MAIDIVKPLKIENSSTGGTELDIFPTEVNPSEDYIATKGIAYNNDENIRIFEENGEIMFQDTVVNVKRSLNALLISNDSKLVEFPLTTNTGNTSYTVFGWYIFRGTNILGLPTAMKMISRINTGTYDLKVFDATNGLTIAERTGINNTNYEIVDIGTLSNIPTNESVFEIQARVSSGVLPSLNLRFFTIQW